MQKRNLEKRLNAMIDSFSEERLRWLVGKGKFLVEKGEIELEEYESLMSEILKTEMERKMIINELKINPHIVSEISKKTQISPKRVFMHLIALRRGGVVSVVEERDGELEFQLL